MDVGAIAMKWLFVPILLIVASVTVLIVANVKAAKQRKADRLREARVQRMMQGGYDDMPAAASKGRHAKKRGGRNFKK